MGSSKATATVLMTEWADPEWGMHAVGRMSDALEPPHPLP
jgi:hypothetical protein